jgi:hypothetical protein
MGVKEIPSGHSQDALFNKPKFGSLEREQEWKKKCKAAREKQKVRIAVAPECAVETVRGVSRKAGEELTVQDCGGLGNAEQLARVGSVIHLSEHELKINTGAARHVVLRAHTSPSGIKDVGDVVESSEYDKADEPSFQYTNAQGHHITTDPVKYESGEEMLRRLVKSGLIEERKTRAKVQAAIKAARGE